MDCRELQRFVHAYVDGEFDVEDRVAFNSHLATCDRCRRIARFEDQFRQRLRDAVAPIAAPPSVRVRVQRALDTDERGRRWLRGWRLLPLSAAAAALAAGVFFWHRSLSEAALSDFAEATIRYHRQRLPLDVRGPDTEPLRRYFAGKVPFAIRAPRFPANARLLGGRLSNLQQHQAAYLAYRVDGERLSVFIIDPQAIPASQWRHHRVGKRVVSWHDVHGYRVAFFHDGGTGYAVAGDMDRERLVSLVSQTVR